MSQADLQEPPEQYLVRRRTLIEATISAISSHGFSNVTLGKIAGLAGLTAGTINFYFDSKQSLLLETLRYVAEEFESTITKAVNGEDEPSARLSALIYASLSDELMTFDKVAVWYAFMSEASSRADYHEICGVRVRRFAILIEEECAQIIKTAGRSSEIDSVAIGRAICGLIDDIWQDMLFQGVELDILAARKRCDAFLASVFPWTFQMPSRKESGVDDDSVRLVYTLPAWVYHTQSFFDLEQEKIFLSSWQLVCHENDIPEPGSYMTYSLLNNRAFVMRVDPGEIKAFHNVCRHRAHLLLDGDLGHTPNGRIVCPYHGWTYDLAGERLTLAFPETFPEHDSQEFSLVQIDCEVYRGFVFIRFKSEGLSIAERMHPVDEEFSHYRPESLVHDATADWVSEVWTEAIDIDWKNGVENFLEDYHFFSGHQGLAGLMQDHYERNAFDTDLSRLSHVLREEPKSGWSERAYSRLLPEQDHLPDSMRRRWTYYALYPNTFFDIYPEYMDFFQIIPLSPGKSLLRGRSYSLSDQKESRLLKAVKYLNTRINRRVQQEDNRLTASVQLGLESGSYQRGILSEKEVLVKQFGDFIRRKVPQANSLRPT